MEGDFHNAAIERNDAYRDRIGHVMAICPIETGIEVCRHQYQGIYPCFRVGAKNQGKPAPYKGVGLLLIPSKNDTR